MASQGYTETSLLRPSNERAPSTRSPTHIARPASTRGNDNRHQTPKACQCDPHLAREIKLADAGIALDQAVKRKKVLIVWPIGHEVDVRNLHHVVNSEGVLVQSDRASRCVALHSPPPAVSVRT